MPLSASGGLSTAFQGLISSVLRVIARNLRFAASTLSNDAGQSGATDIRGSGDLPVLEMVGPSHITACRPYYMEDDAAKQGWSKDNADRAGEHGCAGLRQRLKLLLTIYVALPAVNAGTLSDLPYDEVLGVPGILVALTPQYPCG